MHGDSSYLHKRRPLGVRQAALLVRLPRGFLARLTAVTGHVAASAPI